MKILLSLLTIASLLLPAAGPSVAATLKVPTNFATIQVAIDAASNGDIILIEDGTYTGTGNRNIDFMGKELTVVSKNGAEHTIIDCGNIERGFNIHSGESETSVIQGLTIRNGYASGNQSESRGGGIYADEASPTINNCIITENTAEFQGGGIYCNSATVINCLISENTAVSGSGGGVFCKNSTMTNCEMNNNHTSVGGGGTQCHHSTITGCSATFNTADIGGGGMDNTGSTISDCVIANNESGKAGGICFWLDVSTMTNCIIKDNIGTDFGGGIGCYFNAVPEISNCIITGNSGPVSGGGIFCWAPSPVIINCTITGNSAENGGGVGCVGNSNPEIVNCIIRDNAPEEFYYPFGDGPSVSYSNILNGWTGTGNIDADPKFTTFSNHEFMLKVDSPCVDRGKPQIDDTIYDWHPLYPSWYTDRVRSNMGAYGGLGNSGWLD